MKYFLNIISIIFIHFPLLGQLQVLSDHYQANPLPYNPAYAGADGALTLITSYRQQWGAFDDAPVTNQVCAHLPLFHDRIGLGIAFENNTLGISNESILMSSYAYRMETGKGILSLGLGLGLIMNSYNQGDLILTDEDDEILYNSLERSFYPALSVGGYYYTTKYFLGFSLPSMLSDQYDEEQGDYAVKASLLKSLYLLTFGRKFTCIKQFTVEPSVLFKYLPGSSLQLDMNTMVNYRDRFGLGLGYRSENIMVASTKIQLNNQLALFYSYEFDIGVTNSYLGGSHEFLLKYTFIYSRNVFGPRN